MKEQIRLIKIQNNKMYLDNDFCLPLSRCKPFGILPGETKFKSEKVFVWRVAAWWDEENKIINARVLDYSVSIDDFPADQKTPENAIINGIIFGKFNWKMLEPQLLSSYMQNWIYENTFEVKPEYTPRVKPELQIPRNFSVPVIHEDKIPLKIRAELSSPFETIKNISVHFKNAKVLDGKVEFETSVDGQKIKCNILNPHLVKEFDPVRYLFHKITGNKKFFAEVKLHITSAYIAFISAKSADIEKIDDKFAEALCIWKTQELLKNGEKENTFTEPALTLEDIFSQNDELLNLISRFNDEEKKNILEKGASKNIRNIEQHRYLSGKWHNVEYPLLYTHKNGKGFVFTIRNENRIIYCWE